MADHYRTLSYLLIGGLLIGCLDQRRQETSNEKPVSFAVFEVIDCPSAANAMTVKETNEKLCIGNSPMIDERDIRGARADNAGSRLEFFVTRKAGDRMREATQRLYEEGKKSGKPARLAVVVDGQLMTAPALTGIISDSLVIGGTRLNGQAQRIADALNRR